jgi:hypothetical protein
MRNNVNGVDADDHFIGLLAERLKISARKFARRS